MERRCAAGPISAGVSDVHQSPKSHFMRLCGIVQGYPGNVDAVVTYVLTDGDAKQDKGYLRVIMEATTDQVDNQAP
jgi:hypothetical protein